MNAYYQIVKDGLWKNNPALVQLLGLCPLLAVTNTVINGLGLGLATILTLVASNGLISLLRSQIPDEARLPVLGIFIPLIVTNCSIIGRAEAFAARNSVGPALLDGLMMGIGFTAVLVVLGGMRELIGQGTLFSQAELMFGDIAKNFTITVIDDYRGFLLALLPPGAFIGLGLIVALKNVIDAKVSKQQTVKVEPTAEVATSS